jgi:hypothetical protein
MALVIRKDKDAAVGWLKDATVYTKSADRAEKQMA